MIDRTNINEYLDKIIPTNESISELYTIFNSIIGNSLPIIAYYIDPGNFVVRQRINIKGLNYNNISDLTYPQKQNCTKYGRANIPFHPVFYCSYYSADWESPIPRYISLLEVSDFSIDPISCGIQRTTCSRWDVVEQLNLLALPFSDNYSQSIEPIEQIKETWNNYINNNRINRDALNLIEYMSNEIAKKVDNEIEYFKIAHFVHYLLHINNKTKCFDGLIYPSVAADGQGFNIALKTDTVDRKLKFVVASLCYLIKDKKLADYRVMNHSIVPQDDGTLIFEKRKDFDFSSLKGFDFIN